MSIFRPGEFKITDRAMELAGLPQGAAVLDIGCGQGETVAYLAERYGCDASGIDLSVAMITEGLAKRPDLKIKYGDGEFLEDFSSFSFDGVMMECVLSLINLPDEALHEAYCVLKKGGKLCLSDLYVKEPEPGLLKTAAIEAQRQRSKPHQAGDCSDDCAEEHKQRAVDFRINGRFLLESLIRQLEEVGYRNIVWEDWTAELDSFAAQKLMEDGSLAGCFCGKEFDPKAAGGRTGYFLLVAEKPL